MNIGKKFVGATATGVVFLLALMTAQLHAASPQANAYKLDISVEKSGAQVANPKFAVVFGKAAVATVTSPTTQDGFYRVQATASPGEKAPNGKGTVRVDMVVLEQVAGAWVILGEPSVLGYDGQEAAVDISGAAGSFTVKVRATPEFNQKAVNFKGQSCPALTAPLAKNSSGPIIAIGPGRDCCSVGCNDGSGRTLNCCGAIECCACGSCCRPPGG